MSGNNTEILIVRDGTALGRAALQPDGTISTTLEAMWGLISNAPGYTESNYVFNAPVHWLLLAGANIERFEVNGASTAEDNDVPGQRLEEDHSEPDEGDRPTYPKHDPVRGEGRYEATDGAR